MSTATYDPQQVSLVIAGQIIDGFDESEMVSLDYTEDRFITRVGARGGVSRSRVVNSQGRMTITLMSSSKSNDDLSNLFNTDYYGGGGTFSVLLRDASGTSQASAKTAYILKPPPLRFGKEIGPREWIIQMDDLQVFIGGNNQQ